MRLVQSAQALREALAGSPQGTRCVCSVGACQGWTSVAEERWPADRMTPVATLRDPQVNEPTFEEWHPHGTRYDAPDAPVAPRHFPYNRCDLWHCRQCQRHLLRYTEFGGYYVDPRVRVLDPALIADDAPLP